MMGAVKSADGQEPNAYVTDCSVHRSYQRVVSVHASNDVVVSHTVGFDIRGHAFFVEDGVELRSLFEGNLAVSVRPTANMLTSDLEASGFWSPSPGCIWRHNAAAGCSHFGFWFEFPDNPTGASFSDTVFPFRMPLGGFQNNTAHSNGQNGLHLYPQYRPQVRPLWARQPQRPANARPQPPTLGAPSPYERQLCLLSWFTLQAFCCWQLGTG
jgi:hypothetical protein